MTADKPMVTFYHRKPRAVGNYSVEFIYADVRHRLQERINATVAVSRYESSGVLKRLYNCIEAAFRQGRVNHITGDINYIGIFLRRKKTIQTILDCVHLNNATGIKYRVLWLFWMAIPVRRSKFVTANSISTKNEILKHVSCNPDKIKVIYVAISDRFKRVDKTFNKTNPRILQIGAAHNKNIPRLIEALKGIPCTLEIIGKKSDEYEQLLRENNITCEYKSGLTDDEMLERYAAADILTLVSTYEGFGMPILEAQAVGRPVITANIFSMPEVAADTACLVDPFDTNAIRQGILQIINDDNYRNDLVRKGFENIKRFDPDKIALQYYDLYKETAAQ